MLQVRATVEGLKLGSGVLDRLSAEGVRASLRYALSLIGSFVEKCLLIHASFSFKLIFDVQLCSAINDSRFDRVIVIWSYSNRDR